jgi:FkbM family methyltransferase
VELLPDLITAKAAANRGDHATAEMLLGSLIEQHPTNASAQWEFGRYHGLRCNYKGASGYFARAVELDPNYSSVEFKVKGHTIRLKDYPGSPSAANVLGELADNPYGIFDTNFRHGDVIVDVGGHIGMISIILAKMHPQTRIITYEPVSQTFDRLVENLTANKIANVTPVRKAVNGTRGSIEIQWTPTRTSSSSIYWTDPRLISETVDCDTLDDIFDRFAIDRCTWLKLDCEGAEYNLFNHTSVVNRIDRLVMELHYPAEKRSSALNTLTQAIGRHGGKLPELVIASFMVTPYDFQVTF